MTSVITGDIINSRKAAAGVWLRVLKKELGRMGQTPRHWEIYRGDSFQLEVKKPADALLTAIKIKAAVKRQKGIDARMAIGIGDKVHSAPRISESNGSAFVFSGELVEELKSRKLTLAIKSGNKKFNDEMNLYLKLIAMTMDTWTTAAAETVYVALEHPDKSQEALGKLLKIRQNAVSTRLKRACYYEIKEVIEMYRAKLAEL